MVTVTSTGPAAVAAGVVAVIFVSLPTVNEAAWLVPKVTAGGHL
ncbi:hypothetical protein [Streptomyces vinaceus]